MTGTSGPGPDVLIRDATVVDVRSGSLRPGQDVEISGTRISAVRPAGRAAVPAGTTVIDGTGRFVLPGLIDCHVHIAFNGFVGARSDFRLTLKQLLVHGITAAVDFFTAGGRFPGSSAETVRDDVNSGSILGPWLLTSYGCINAPGGFCSCSVGAAAAEVVTLADVHRHLDRICATRPDFIKIVYDDVFGTLPNLSPSLLRALIEETHARGYRAAVHIETLRDATEAVECGADIIGHGIAGELPGSLLDRMAAAGTVVIPTLSSYESRSLPRERIALPAFSPADSVTEYLRHPRTIYEVQGLTGQYRTAFRAAAGTLVPLRDAGVRVVAGSDSGTWYTFPGDALHRELSIYVDHGLSPAEAIRMATLDAAEAFSLQDRFGTVEAGREASLVVLDDDPLADIRATRRIDTVLLSGQVLDLPRLRREITAPPVTPAPEMTSIPCSPHHLGLPLPDPQI